MTETQTPFGIAEAVREFHEAFDLHRPTALTLPSRAVAVMRQRLLDEQLAKLAVAVAAEDLVDVAHKLADAVYVLYGTAITYGIPLDAVLEEVHRSNMTKFGADGKPILREDGKVLRGPNYEPPDVFGVLAGIRRDRDKGGTSG